MIYGLLLFWFFVSGPIFSFLKERTRKNAVFISCLLPAMLIAALRSETVGKDTSAYMTSADLYSIRGSQFSGFGVGFEPADKILVSISSLFGNPGRAFIVISSVLTIFMAFYAIRIIADKPNIGYCLYFLSTLFFFNLSALRQSLAISVVMLATAAAYKRHWILSVLLALCACLFHKTAFIAVPIFIAARWAIPNGILLFLTVLMTLVLYSLKIFDNSAIFAKLNYPLYEGTEYAIGITKLPFVFGFIFSLLFFIFRNNNQEYQKVNHEQGVLVHENSRSDLSETFVRRIALYAACAGIILCSLMFTFGTVFRMEYYNFGMVLVALPTVLDKISSVEKRRNYKLVYYSLFIFFFAVFNIFEGDVYGIFEYHLMFANSGLQM